MDVFGCLGTTLDEYYFKYDIVLGDAVMKSKSETAVSESEMATLESETIVSDSGKAISESETVASKSETPFWSSNGCLH